MTEGYLVLKPSKQLVFSHKLEGVRSKILREALRMAVRKSKISEVDKELIELAGEEKVSYLAKYGLRGEILFPIPTILRAYPSVLGYYRLVLGFSKKEFYSQGPFGEFMLMETKGKLRYRTNEKLSDMCLSLIESAWILIQDVERTSEEHLRELMLLTLGAQFSGSSRAKKGAKKTQVVYDVVRKAVSENIIGEGRRSIRIKNDAGREVSINFAQDPDISIEEKLSPKRTRKIAAVEIKGGSDVSNIFNRLGESEKSHIKAKREGYSKCWTIVGVNISEKTVKKVAPTTDRCFSLEEIQNRDTKEYADFKKSFFSLIGIKKKALS